MSFAVAGFNISRGTLLLPGKGVWSLSADLVGGVALAVGARVAAMVGDIELSGTVRSSALHVGVAEALIVGGADGWSKVVGARSYRADNGVRLSTVAGDLARDAGETLAPLGALEASLLGYAWIRPEGLASHAIEELTQAWHVRPDGSTQIGERTPVVRSGAVFGVEAYRPMIRTATLTSPTDELSLFLPGTTLSGDGLPTLSIRATTIKIARASARAEVQFA